MHLVKKFIFSIFVLLTLTPAANSSSIKKENKFNLPEVISYRSASCSCCKKWVTHLRSNGLIVFDNVIEDISTIKNQYAIPNNLRSCHTAKMGNYILEGHVHFESIKKLNLNSPNISGIAVPGMPPGSPGMELHNHESHSHNQKKSYKVFSFGEDIKEEVFDTVIP